MTTIRTAQSSDITSSVQTLFREYSASLDVEFCRKEVDGELAGLGTDQAPLRIYLAHEGDALAGCIALKQMESGAGELARLFVRPEYRRQGVARDLVDHAEGEAQRLGMPNMVLHTFGGWQAAIALYRALGYAEVPPYHEIDFEGIVWLGKPLAPEKRAASA